MSHYVLKHFGGDSLFSHIRTECVTADMGCDFRKLHFILSIIFVKNMFEILLPVQSNHRHIILVKKKKFLVTINHWFADRYFSILNDTLKTLCDLMEDKREAIVSNL